MYGRFSNAFLTYWKAHACGPHTLAAIGRWNLLYRDIEGRLMGYRQQNCKIQENADGAPMSSNVREWTTAGGSDFEGAAPRLPVRPYEPVLSAPVLIGAGG